MPGHGCSTSACPVSLGAIDTERAGTMDLGLSGAKVLVTGASRGIGRAISQAFAEEGADLALCARGERPLEAEAERLTESVRSEERRVGKEWRYGWWRWTWKSRERRREHEQR